jgi:squalene-hopene/tetraprenyl-beta-curcumene cyclase
MVPLFILCTYKPRAKNPRNVHIRELFTTPPEQERTTSGCRPPGGAAGWQGVLPARSLRASDRSVHSRKAMRKAATRRAESWFIER